LPAPGTPRPSARPLAAADPTGFGDAPWRSPPTTAKGEAASSPTSW
jgi:hypothetical protein